MKLKLSTDVDCTSEWCNKCRFQEHVENLHDFAILHCLLFDTNLEHDDFDASYALRCKACLRAEKRHQAEIKFLQEED